MKTFEELAENVRQWAKEKGIADKATLLTQINKTQEELTETRDAIIRLEELENLPPKEMEDILSNEVEYRCNELRIEIKDGIGDQMVTLIIEAMLVGLDANECLEHAWDEIKNRTGKMVNGTFVKDEGDENLRCLWVAVSESYVEKSLQWRVQFVADTLNIPTDAVWEYVNNNER